VQQGYALYGNTRSQAPEFAPTPAPPMRPAIRPMDLGVPEIVSGGGGSSAGSGGGGVSEAQRLQNDQMREAERLYERTRTEVERYNAQIADLQALYEAVEVDASAFSREMDNLQAKLLDAQFGPVLDEFGRFSDDLAKVITQAETLGDVFRGLGDIIESTLARSAAAMISTGFESLLTQGFTALVGGVSGGTNIFSGLLGALPSNEGGGFTGYGARVGGVDGRGGILSINHPNETIIDHTKGQTMGNVVALNVTVNGARGNAEIYEMAYAGAQQAVQENNYRIAQAQRRR
jgi:hypothetical protein